MNTQTPVPVPALIVAVYEYRIRCDITYTRSDGSTREVECASPIGHGGARLNQVYTDRESAEAALECAIESGKSYEEHIARMAEAYPGIYDRIVMHNYRLVRRECTQWHTL